MIVTFALGLGVGVVAGLLTTGTVAEARSGVCGKGETGNEGITVLTALLGASGRLILASPSN